MGRRISLVLALLLAGCSPPAQEPGQKLDAAAVAACREALDALTQAGTIRERPRPGTIVVEETQWAALPYRDKQNLLSAVACDVWQTATPPDGEFVRAEGYRSGERLLTMSNDNVF